MKTIITAVLGMMLLAGPAALANHEGKAHGKGKKDCPCEKKCDHKDKKKCGKKNCKHCHEGTKEDADKGEHHDGDGHEHAEETKKSE